MFTFSGLSINTSDIIHLKSSVKNVTDTAIFGKLYKINTSIIIIKDTVSTQLSKELGGTDIADNQK